METASSPGVTTRKLVTVLQHLRNQALFKGKAIINTLTNQLAREFYDASLPEGWLYETSPGQYIAL
eukprot:12045794-Ditylum_brightwellii.AAC.1